MFGCLNTTLKSIFPEIFCKFKYFLAIADFHFPFRSFIVFSVLIVVVVVVVFLFSCLNLKWSIFFFKKKINK
jgi:hypothetical protein